MSSTIEEMVAGDVGVGSTGFEGGIAPQDKIDYGGDDTRRPFALGQTNDKKKKKSKKDKKTKTRISIQRRPVNTAL
jgi:hypothetical protein